MNNKIIFRIITGLFLVSLIGAYAIGSYAYGSYAYGSYAYGNSNYMHRMYNDEGMHMYNGDMDEIHDSMMSSINDPKLADELNEMNDMHENCEDILRGYS